MTNSTDKAPERIWMDPDIKFPECEKQYGCDVEYVRADCIAELEANINIKADFIEATINQLAASDQRIEELEVKLSESEALLAKAVDEKLDALDTLDAWFDRRKLAHDAVDQAVVAAASGYLRTSRSGGMTQDESDLVLGCIQDMARLSLFADLFARTTLAELTGGNDE